MIKHKLVAAWAGRSSLSHVRENLLDARPIADKRKNGGEQNAITQPHASEMLQNAASFAIMTPYYLKAKL